MRCAAGAGWITLVLAAVVGSPAFGQAASPLMLRGVTVVDVVKGELLPNRNITVSGDRVASVSAAGLPGNGPVRYAIPGLWDMHATSLEDPAAYVARGITGIRDMSSADLEQTLALYKQIEAGKIVGPRMITGGPGLRATNPEEARAAFDRLFDTDADFVRFQSDLDFEAYIALAERSRKWRYPLVGPLPPSVRLRDVLSLRQASIEGTDGLDRLTREEACDGFAGGEVAGTWFTPLLASHGSKSRRKAEALVRLMHECHAPVLAGGGVIEEVEALVEEAGFTPAEALRAATYEPARYLNSLETLGEIAIGRFADVVLLDANPLEDIANLRRVSAVVLRGRLFSRQAIVTLRQPPTIRGWSNAASTSATPKPAASSVKPPASSAKPASPTH